MRLIDADALIAKAYIMQEPNGFIHSVVTERQIIAAPTIDAVPVVRCKDCKHCLDRKTYLRCVINGFNNGHEVKSIDFCSYGEREENV